MNYINRKMGLRIWYPEYSGWKMPIIESGTSKAKEFGHSNTKNIIIKKSAI
jgi:hypothetical protein